MLRLLNEREILQQCALGLHRFTDLEAAIKRHTQIAKDLDSDRISRVFLWSYPNVGHTRNIHHARDTSDNTPYHCSHRSYRAHSSSITGECSISSPDPGENISPEDGHSHTSQPLGDRI